MRVMPSKRVCEKFKLVYELQGAQKAVDFLASYYGIAKMRVKVDGKRVGNKNDAVYDNNVAYFRKDRLNRVLILHEFFHHLVHIKRLNMPEKREEKEAHRYARAVAKSLIKPKKGLKRVTEKIQRTNQEKIRLF